MGRAILERDINQSKRLPFRVDIPSVAVWVTCNAYLLLNLSDCSVLIIIFIMYIIYNYTA